METRKVSNEQLRKCIDGVLNNEVSNTFSCMALAGHRTNVTDILSLYTGKSAMITLEQAKLIMGIRSAFQFICDEIDFNDCSQLIITLAKILGTRIDGHYGDLIIGENAYKRWHSCNSRDKTPEERAIAWFSSIVYYEPFDSMNEIVALLMFNKVLVENGIGYAIMSNYDEVRLPKVIEPFRMGEFTECPEELGSLLESFIVRVD